jgi:hypothetical protein
MIVWTSRCWAPSCRWRATRRRSSSVAATIRAPDAVRSDRAGMFPSPGSGHPRRSENGKTAPWRGFREPSAGLEPATPSSLSSACSALPCRASTRARRKLAALVVEMDTVDRARRIRVLVADQVAPPPRPRAHSDSVTSPPRAPSPRVRGRRRRRVLRLPSCRRLRQRRAFGWPS